MPDTEGISEYAALLYADGATFDTLWRNAEYVVDKTLLLAKIELEYLEETFFGKPVEIRTYVLRIGTSSVLVGQEAWQEGELKATGTATMVNFDKHTRKSVPIPADVKKRLSEHLLESGQ